MTGSERLIKMERGAAKKKERGEKYEKLIGR